MRRCDAETETGAGDGRGEVSEQVPGRAGSGHAGLLQCKKRDLRGWLGKAGRGGSDAVESKGCRCCVVGTGEVESFGVWERGETGQRENSVRLAVHCLVSRPSAARCWNKLWIVVVAQREGRGPQLIWGLGSCTKEVRQSVLDCRALSTRRRWWSCACQSRLTGRVDASVASVSVARYGAKGK